MSKPRPDDFDTWEEYEFACDEYQDALDDWGNYYHDEQLIEEYFEDYA
jgi:hypothetical protein